MKETWVKSTLGEICHTTSGGTPSRRKPEYYQGNIPWVKSGELNHNIIRDTEEHISEEAVKKSSAKIFPAGTLLIALYGATIGKLAILGVPATTNQAICGIFKNELFETSFLFNYLFHTKQKLIGQGTGGAQPNISQTILKKLPVPIAPLPEQRAIVSKIEQLFSELDNGIANLKAAKAKLETYRQAVLKKAFEGHPAIKQLGQIAEVKRGKSKHRPRNDKSLFGGKYPFIQTGEVRAANGGTIRSFSNTYSEKGLQQSKLWPKGTLCLTIAANIGETAFLGFDACFPDSVVGIKPFDNELRLKYLNFYVQKIKKEMDHEASATAQKNINIKFLERLEIPLPSSIEDQFRIEQMIESRFSVCDKLSESIDQSLEQAEALRQSILKKAFEGRLLSEAEVEACKKEPDWEPAEKLVARIERSRNERVKQVKAGKTTAG